MMRYDECSLQSEGIDNLDTNWFSNKLVSKHAFEDRFASLLDVKYALAFSSGLAALHIALLVCGVSAGDEVLVDPLFNYGAVATIQCNAIPIFYDVSLDNFMPTVSNLQEKITWKTKVIVVSNIFGCTSELKKIRTLCDETGIYLIEDSSQALMCKSGEKYAGTYGDLGVYSFHSTSHLILGGGGALVTGDTSLFHKALILHGDASGKRLCDEEENYLGYSCSMHELVAKMALSKIDCLDRIIQYHKNVGELIRKELCSANLTPQKNAYSEHVYCRIGVLVNNEDLFCHLENKLGNNRLMEFGLNNKRVVPDLPVFKNRIRKDLYNCPYDCIFAGEHSKRKVQVANAQWIVKHLMSIKIQYGVPLDLYRGLLEEILEAVDG